jgi:uracil-DNA glycosylase
MPATVTCVICSNSFPGFTTVVLVGKKAQKAERRIQGIRPDLRIFRCPHPSPLFVNNKPGNRDLILDVLRDVAAHLGTHSVAPPE